MAARRLEKAKEKPLLDERIPHPYREIVSELKAIKAKLDEISQKLRAVPIVAPPVAPPTAVPGAPPPVIVPGVAPVGVMALSKEDFLDLLLEALEKHGALKLADDLYVETVDLSKDRSTTAKIEEFSKLKGIALTIFRTTGTFDLYLNEKDDRHKLTFDSLTYPQTFLLDWFDLKTVYIGNAAQSGAEAKLIAWKRLS